MEYGPKTPHAQFIHQEKYRSAGESFGESMYRIAGHLADSDDHYRKFLSIIRNQRFLPAGRIQLGAGSSRKVTLSNCFFAAKIHDSLCHHSDSIMNVAKQVASTLRMGGGVGLDFSTIRPAGDRITSLGSTASGPVSFMGVFDALCHTISSSGHRRGAMMGVLRVDHPDIETFILAKQDATGLTGFNLSIGITDDFMHAVRGNRSFDLKFNGQVYRTISARGLFDRIMRSTWDYAEPGVLFLDTINRMNNLSYCETITGTNPCGEIPIPAHGNCLLGSFNLPAYLVRTREGWEFNFEQLVVDIAPVVRAMDNVVDRGFYPIAEQEREAKSKRRMGLGVTGVANALEALGHSYGSDDYLLAQDFILQSIMRWAYSVSSDLAREKGSFPLYSNKFLEGEFFTPERFGTALYEKIARYGIRNSHLTGIAPTGTISLAADNVSSGIEPVFALESLRTIITAKGSEQYLLQDYGKRFLSIEGKTSDQVTVREHLDVLTRAQQYMDNAVSKTLNVPSDVSWEDFKGIYTHAWANGAKGCSTFRIGGLRPSMMCQIDPATGSPSCE